MRSEFLGPNGSCLSLMNSTTARQPPGFRGTFDLAVVVAPLVDVMGVSQIEDDVD